MWFGCVFCDDILCLIVVVVCSALPLLLSPIVCQCHLLSALIWFIIAITGTINHRKNNVKQLRTTLGHNNNNKHY